MIRLPVKEWQCKYAVMHTCLGDGRYRFGRSPVWECAIKQMTLRGYHERGCFGCECCHNAESDDNKGKAFFGRCPFEGDGKCTCMHEDGSSDFCPQGEKFFKVDQNCSLGWFDPLGCRHFKKLDDAEMVLLAINYFQEYCFRPFVRANQGKCYFQTWYRDMLKKLGAPKELYEFGYVNAKKESEEKVHEAHKKVSKIFAKWVKGIKEK